MRVIGYHVTNTGLIANSDGETCSHKPYIDFLLHYKPDSVKVFYYLGQDVANLAKACEFSQQEVKMLHESSAGKVNIPPYKIRYVKDRFLNLQKGFYKNAPYCYIYDAHQYEDTMASENETRGEAVEKAVDACRIGTGVLSSLNSLGINTERLISPIRAFEDKVLSKMSLPKVQDIPEMAGFYAYECCVLGQQLS